MARPGYSAGIDQRPQTITFSILVGAALTAFAGVTGLIKARMPQKGQVIGVTLNVGGRGGTHVTSSLDVLIGGSSMLVAAFDVDALTPGTPVDKEGSALAAAAASVAKDALIQVDTAEAGGTAPTWKDVVLQIDYVPLGD